MKKYTSKEIEAFLQAIDQFLEEESSVIIIGGTAAALAYKVTEATKDIDTWNSVEGLKDAYAKAKEKTNLDIPLEKVSVSDAPYYFEERLTYYKPDIFKKLKVIIPEVADLILMKTLRSYAHDLDAIEQMVKSQKVDADVLIQRYIDEMGAIIGDKRKHDISFLAMLERCYGDLTSKKAAKKMNFKI